uniref:Transmembrane protein n=1 Tax=Oryza brachyantha TaxID=4533 RepID=J3L9P1_ORYBR
MNKTTDQTCGNKISSLDQTPSGPPSCNCVVAIACDIPPVCLFPLLSFSLVLAHVLYAVGYMFFSHHFRCSKPATTGEILLVRPEQKQHLRTQDTRSKRMKRWSGTKQTVFQFGRLC